MKVILFRHGSAGSRDASRWPDDSLRPLTSAGERRTRAAARGLVGLEGVPDQILSSPYERAAATARILAEVADNQEVKMLDELEPNGSFRRILEHLRGLPSDAHVALVGHEPDLGKLAGTLLVGAPAAIPLKKAGVCIIEFVGPVQAGDGELKGYYPPRVLRRLSGQKVKA
jgi:phosphohistidine phosphatase